MTIPGFDSAQHAYDNAEPDNTDICEGCADNDFDACDGTCRGWSRIVNYEPDPDDARDREYAYGDED